MALMKSVRIDFPASADAASIPDSGESGVIGFMQDVFLAAATNDRVAPAKRKLAEALCRALADSKVENYDSRHGGPVFYIP